MNCLPFLFVSNSKYHLTFSPLLLLSTLILVLYSNTLNSPWILDDKPNIVNNPSIHLEGLTLESFTNTFFASPLNPGELYRPLASASFAINWYFGRDHVWGYHLTNIVIHILAAFFLYLSATLLLQRVPQTNKSKQQISSVALLSSLLWAANPIQVQAVTYIVQRMASLAALFYIVGIYCFLKARTTPNRSVRLVYASGCFLTFLCALATKEHTITFPCALLLIEIIFFNTGNMLLSYLKRKRLYAYFLWFGITIAVSLGIHFVISAFSFESRTFTLIERILTQPRVLFFYLSFLFFPLASRFSLEHDFALSSSLVSPATTLLSLIGCFFLIGASIRYGRKYPLLSFSILFFFLGHAVESTILPLEMIFEHRNYLPSMFLFLPVSFGILKLMECHERHPGIVQQLAVLVIPLLIIFFGANTYLRNGVWSSEFSLVYDANTKAPDSSRAATNLAEQYFHRAQFDQALELAQHAYYLNHPSRNHAQAIALNAQGAVLHALQQEEKAIGLFRGSLTFLPDYTEARKNLIVSLSNQNMYREALALFTATDQRPRYSDPNLEAIILVRLNEADKALKVLRAVPRRDILEINIVTGIGKTLSMMGHIQQADFFLRQAAPFSPGAALMYIDNLLKAGNTIQAASAAKHALSRFSATDILRRAVFDNPKDYPVASSHLYDFIRSQALTKSRP